MKICIGEISQLCQRDRKSHGNTEVLYFFKFFLLNPFQTELHQSTEGDTISVRSTVSSERSKTVVEGMRCSNIDIIRTHAGEIDASLNNIFQRLGNHMIFTGNNGSFSELLQILIAILRQYHSGTGNTGIFQAGRLGTKRSSSLKISSEGISHSGN